MSVGHLGNREFLTVNAALGERPMDTEGQWAERPDVPSPEDSGPRMPRYPGTESIMDRIDTRLASALDHADLPGPGMPAGRSALWARIPAVLDMSAATLAILGAPVPFWIGPALGTRAARHTPAHPFRVGRLEPTARVLSDQR